MSKEIGRLLVVLTLTVSGCNWTELVNVNSVGEQSNSHSLWYAVSGDGRYVVFDSGANNLVEGDTNSEVDVFLRDTFTGTTQRVSLNAAGEGGNGRSEVASISGDGRYVAFWSFASNLVVDDTNSDQDIFVRDTATGTTIRVSVDSEGNQANNDTQSPSISGNGRYVAFSSSASNLVPGDTNNSYDIFVHDLNDGSTTRVSVDSAGNEGNSWSQSPSISYDGRYVAFESDARNLVAGDTNLARDTFVHDRETGNTSRVSVNSVGIQGNSYSQWSSISGDGRYVAYWSRASNLVLNDTNLEPDVFLRDTATNTTNRVSVDSVGNQANGMSIGQVSISGDGRYVAFQSNASNLVADDFNNFTDVFIHDRVIGTTSRASLDALGVEGNGNGNLNGNQAISADGRYVVFYTTSTNVVESDTNGVNDIVIRAVPHISVNSVIPDMLPIGFTTPVTISGTNFLTGATPLLKGAKFSNVVIVDENTITADVTVKAATLVGVEDVLVGLPGTGPGSLTGVLETCVDCVTFVGTPPGCE